ncbi:flagellar motor protein MotB [Allopusillimonas ginsengisoli]|uniref:flagellar motor protein MotB n=1 Tax=Allopusillimonas ginsengisoli TaxID=453575 RepID=UPI0010207F69|nr:flagellar motor protein MotB [Allopusillimonas ginsengisoli]TEA79425.1 flagellar motor protein MotB [Allopusillimonas ginsengisoli]
MSKSQPRVVIRRKRPCAEAAHGGSWKIAYADLMTAMMAFFLVMWLLSMVPRNELGAIAEYFRMPLMTAITGGPRMGDARNMIPGGEPSVIPNTQPLPGNGAGDAQELDMDQRDTLSLENLKSDLESLIQTDPILRQFRPQLLLDMTPDGLRVQIIDRQNRPMFATGSAQVQPYMQDILQQLGPMFNGLPNSISISGHTDSLRYATGEREYSNWELSADRANAARKELVNGGMDEAKIKRVVGLSSSVSLVKENPAAAVNRRISIVVLNRQAERRIDQQHESRASGARVDEHLSSMQQDSTSASSAKP